MDLGARGFGASITIGRKGLAAAAAGLLLATLAAGCIQSGGPGAAAAEDWTTRPERTDFQETSSYAEVVAYLERAAAAHPDLHLTRFGYSNEGRALPLLVAGPVADASPEAVREASEAGGIPIVYLKGNIHAGEVAGKEALLRLVRDLATQRRPELLRDLILLIGPIYNADGNERVGVGNRPRQHGPTGGMGTRANAQGLDLNRDQMKLDSPEGRSLARLMSTWDPHVLVDLHVTNGTRHAYHLTYSPPLHPATPEGVDRLLRDELLPDVTDRIRDEYGWHYWHYGNVSTRGGVRGWYTFDHRPRFVTNYTGLRNRIGILSEAYSYATFEDRILASERFVDEILAWIQAHADRVVQVVADEDARDLRGSRIPVRGGFPDEAPVHTILMGDVVEEPHPWTGAPLLRRLDVVQEDPMPAFVAFTGIEDEVVPHAYLVRSDLAPVLDRLRAHGVRMEEGSLAENAGPAFLPQGELQRFVLRTVSVSPQNFQGRNEVSVEGTWEAVPPEDTADAPGWLLVPMDQPLARLAFLLLEPRADDGLLNWALMDPWLEEGGEYPVRRVLGGE